MILSVSTLHLLVRSLLHISLKDARSLRLVEAYDLEDVGSIDPSIGSAPHNSDLIKRMDMASASMLAEIHAVCHACSPL